MDENQINEEKELTQEEKLKKDNDDANVLLTKKKKKKEEYDKISDDLKSKEQEIKSIINEINTAKETFINDINNKLEEYETKFKEKDEEINNQKTSSIEMFQDLENQFNKLVTDYESKSEQGQQEIEDKIAECTELLNKEQNEFDKFIKDNKLDYEQQYEKIKTLVSQYQASTTESLTSIKARLDEATTNSEKIKQIEAQAKVFKDALDEYIANMTSKTEEINEKTKKYSEDTELLINTNTKLTEEIKEQLQKATGVSLFHMFQKRKEALEENQGWWLAGVIISIAILIIFSGWIIKSLPTVTQHNTVDWFKDAILKFTLSTPIIYLLYFLTDRYTKLRRLIEEYSFKSAISLALTPYFDLVKGLDDETQEKDKDFLIAVIGNIFKTPTDKVFKTKEAQFDLDFSNYYKNIANVFVPNQDNNKEGK